MTQQLSKVFDEVHPNEVQKSTDSLKMDSTKERDHSSGSSLGRLIGDALLREYAAQLSPIYSSSSTSTYSKSAKIEDQEATAPTDLRTREASKDEVTTKALQISPVRSPGSFFGLRNRAFSADMPQQSIMKALASRASKKGNAPPAISLPNSTPQSHNNQIKEFGNSRHSSTSSLKLSIPQQPEPEAIALTPSSMRYTALQSPCFFHQRFEDAINIDRVLEEVAAEEDGYSHSRLMQTATSVREISKQLQRRPIKRAVRSVMIVTKARDNGLVYLTRELVLWLLSTPRYGSDLGVTVYVDAKLRNSKRFDAKGIIAQNRQFRSMLRYWDPDLCWTSPEKFDLVLTLGGDGTVLYTSFSLFQRIVPPVLAFSLGSLGFLTNFEFASYRESLNKVMGDEGMRVNLRMRFTCTIFRADPAIPRGKKTSPLNTAEMIEGEQFEVLNEVVIDRGPSPYVSNLELYGDDELITVVQADGCIFSTPTGSTAYSLSAGGPLTHPSIPGIVLSPICPHTLSFRPMVLSDSLLLKVCIPRGSRSTAYASFDGKGRVELRRGDCVQIEAGRFPFPTVVGEHGTGGEWFESVRRALRWNTRGAMQKSFQSSNKPGAAPQATEDEDPLVAMQAGDADEPEHEEDEDWDINPDDEEVHGATDSGIGASEASSHYASPKRSDSLNSIMSRT